MRFSVRQHLPAACGGCTATNAAHWRAPGQQRRTDGAVPRKPARAGYIEGKNIQIEFLSRRARPLVFRKWPPRSFTARSTSSSRCDACGHRGQERHARIPIVMAPAGDPVGTGLVASLARPGGNVTGMSGTGTETGPRISN